MRLFIFNIKRFTVYGIAVVTFILVSLMVHSCKKPTITSENFEASNLRVVNGLLPSSPVKFYLDTFNLTYTGTISYAATTKYMVVVSGLRQAAFYSTSTPRATLATANIQLAAKKSYTLFLTGSAKPIFTEDDLSQPSADKAKIRLANLSSSAGNVDLTIQLQDVVSLPQPKPEVGVLQNVGAETISKYVLITVPTSKGNYNRNLYTVRIYEAGTQKLLGTTKSVDFRGTSTYTIFVSGIKDGLPALAASSQLELLDF